MRDKSWMIARYIMKGDLAMVAQYMEGESDIDTFARNEVKTPLGIAASYGHIEIMKYLLERGADINLPDSGGWTPLIWATSSNKPESISFLLTMGADRKPRTNGGKTALDMSTESRKFFEIRLDRALSIEAMLTEKE